MLVVHPAHIRMNERSDIRPSAFVPSVYEHIEPARWEYHVLTIDAREAPLPGEDELNALGKEGWILVGLLDERATGRGGLVYYYFARQARE